MEETWLPIPGWESLYEVSDQGRIRGLRYGRVLKPRLDAYGYLIFELHAGRPAKPTTVKVHRIVAMAFHGPAPVGKPEVDHKNRDRTDNRSTNLRWSSVPDNRVPARCKSRSGMFGVRYQESKRQWQAYATVQRKFKSLGYFATAEDAAEARYKFDVQRGFNVSR